MLLRSLILVCLLALFGSIISASNCYAADKEISGIWQGALDVGGIKLRLVIHIDKKPDGTLTGVLDSIDQNANGIPITNITFKAGKVHFDVKSIGGQYDGVLTEDGSSIKGTFRQGAELPLDLKRNAKIPSMHRPQEPKKPYPYNEEDVTYSNTEENVTLAATFTLPKGKGPFPAVVLITGSGPQDRDEALMGHRPFFVLSDYLTRRGIAVLRADDRGVGKSTGNFGAATTFDFSRDAEAGVKYLLTRKEINPAKIGLIGHSEGGVIAPMVAARSKDVAFIVLMAGTGVNGEQILYKQEELIARAGGASEDDIKSSIAINRKIFTILKDENDTKVADTKIHHLLDNTYDNLPEAARKALGDRKSFSDSRSSAVMAPWFRYFLILDPAVALRKVKCPVLAINGSKDLQVYPQQNLPAIEEALKAGGNKDFTIKLMPDMNHLFQVCKTGALTEYPQIEETISPLALATMGDWITARTGGK